MSARSKDSGAPLWRASPDACAALPHRVATDNGAGPGLQESLANYDDGDDDDQRGDDVAFDELHRAILGAVKLAFAQQVAAAPVREVASNATQQKACEEPNEHEAQIETSE